MLKRYTAPALAAAILAMAVLFLPATPASATPSDGIESVVPAYVFADDPLLEALCDTDDVPEPPAYVIINIGNGETDQVGELDLDAQCLRGRGIKVLAYVHACASNCGTLTPTLRSTFNVAADMNRYVDPFSSYPTLKPDRNNGSQFIDGFFIDEQPRDCGPIETPTNNTANDQDYVLQFSAYTDAANDLFDLWNFNGDDPVVVANPGTAFRGCYIGYKAYGPMPDFWVSAENDGTTYLAGWAGGNIITGGTFGTTYEDGNSYCADCFWHIVHQVSTQANTEAVIDLADARGASAVTVTDDGADANPWDEIPGTSGGPSLQLLGAPIYAQQLTPMSIRFDYTNDWLTTQTGATRKGVYRSQRDPAGYDPACDNPGTPLVTERCAFPQQAMLMIYDYADANCGPGSAAAGDWGTQYNPGDPPDAALYDCMQTLMLDDSGRDKQGYVCVHLGFGNVRDWSDVNANEDTADCQDDDATGGYIVDGVATPIMQEVFWSTDARAQETLRIARDWDTMQVNESGSTRNATCVEGSSSFTVPVAHWNCP